MLLTLLFSAAAWTASADLDTQACYQSLHQPQVKPGICQQAVAARTETDPDYARLLSALALQQARLGDLTAATASMQRAVDQAAVDDLIVGVNHGNLALLTRRYEEALKHYEQALLQHPKVPAAVHLNRSLALRALGLYQAAQTAYVDYLTASDAALANRSNKDMQTNTISEPPTQPEDLRQEGF